MAQRLQRSKTHIQQSLAVFTDCCLWMNFKCLQGATLEVTELEAPSVACVCYMRANTWPDLSDCRFNQHFVCEGVLCCTLRFDGSYLLRLPGCALCRGKQSLVGLTYCSRYLLLTLARLVFGMLYEEVHIFTAQSKSDRVRGVPGGTLPCSQHTRRSRRHAEESAG